MGPLTEDEIREIRELLPENLRKWVGWELGSELPEGTKGLTSTEVAHTMTTPLKKSPPKVTKKDVAPVIIVEAPPETSTADSVEDLFMLALDDD